MIGSTIHREERACEDCGYVRNIPIRTWIYRTPTGEEREESYTKMCQTCALEIAALVHERQARDLRRRAAVIRTRRAERQKAKK